MPAQKGRVFDDSCKWLVQAEGPTYQQTKKKHFLRKNKILRLEKKGKRKTLERERQREGVTGKRERARRGCGWRASRRGQEQGTSTACISRPPKVDLVAVAAADDDVVVVVVFSYLPSNPSRVRPLVWVFGPLSPSSSRRLVGEEESPSLFLLFAPSAPSHSLSLSLNSLFVFHTHEYESCDVPNFTVLLSKLFLTSSQ